MTNNMWQSADTIARELVERDCDPNEAHKAFVYLRTHNDGERFLRFLNTLVEHGRFLVRSRRTLDYYKAIQEVCRRHLNAYRSDAASMEQVLGWAVRLMRFYMSQQMLDVSADKQRHRQLSQQRKKSRR